MDKAVIRNLEPALRYLDGVDSFMGQAREGSAYMAIQFRRGMDLDQLTAEVQKAVDSITTLPEAAERPVVHAVRGFERVAKILITGPFSEEALKNHAVQIRDGLLSAGIDRITMTGTRDEEIRVTVPERRLARHHLTMDDIATAIKRETQDRPAGSLRGGLDRSVPGAGRADTADEIGKIILRAGKSGEHLALHHVAQVEDIFDPVQIRGLHRGAPAIRLEIQRTPSADTLETNRILHSYIEKISKTLPQDLKIELFDVRADYLKERINLLFKNGLQGLVIVVLVLFIFLGARIAFWVAFGIPIALMATFAVMWITGQSINMFSLFALMLALGIIVDDAIVVSEHTATLHKGGLPIGQAVEQGALRMSAPVIAATLTTIIAFLPTFFMTGRVGDMLQALPLVVTAALAASLIECFFILPAHLRHALSCSGSPSRFRRFFDQGFSHFRDRIFGSLVEFIITWRYATLAMVVALLLIATSMVISGKLRFNFFPSPEAERIGANVVLNAGISQERAVEIVNLVEQSLYDTVDGLTEDNEELVEAVFITLGSSGRNVGDNLAELKVQLTSSEVRSVRTPDIIRAWRKNVPKIAGTRRVAIFEHRSGPPGRDIDLELYGDDVTVLKLAAGEIIDLVSAVPGTSGVSDDLPYGKPELVMELLPRGAALGFTIEEVGRQVRDAFEGSIPRRFAEGDDEITIRVTRTSRQQGGSALRGFELKSIDNEFVPLTEVVSLTERQGFSAILRKDGKTSVSVTADLDSAVITTAQAIEQLEAGDLPNILSKYGLNYKFTGRAQERANAFADLQMGIIIALAVIYIVLAWVFSNYWRPIAIMMIIPFGLVGAVFGHWILDYNLTILSLIGLLGLSGILVNDSIIMVSRMDERLATGESLQDAAIGASRDRLRAVLLTSLTTIGGLFPLMFEKSLQAQFLLPMAITIVFGLALATLLVLFLVPALIGIGNDIGGVVK
ncbi:MAG: efflux RND transporter permease subunit, partial [Henriciella sp.]|nr:efflux RND transporter permease subunit [Henriciella sp.]